MTTPYGDTPATNFTIVAGKPFYKEISVTLPTGRSWWLAPEAFEVQAQIRKYRTVKAPLVLDVGSYLTVTMPSIDVVLVVWEMTGAQTRLLTRGGYFDVILSATGVDDDRIYPIIHGYVRKQSFVTSHTGVTDE